MTPGHFLIDGPLTAIPEPTYGDQTEGRLSRWQLLKKHRFFLNRWQTECLQRHRAISKWHHPSNQVQQGSLVLVVDERYPPAKWPLARILELYPGSDGLTRVVTDLRTATSTLKQPITKLCILSTHDQNYSKTSFPETGGMFGKGEKETQK